MNSKEWVKEWSEWKTKEWSTPEMIDTWAYTRQNTSIEYNLLFKINNLLGSYDIYRSKTIDKHTVEAEREESYRILVQGSYTTNEEG